jgi:hypothetical protein
MELTIGLKSILGWERLSLFGRYGYVEMIMCLTTKLFYFAGYLQSYWYTSFVVVSATFTGSRPLYEGLFTSGSYGEGYFFPTWMAA